MLSLPPELRLSSVALGDSELLLARGCCGDYRDNPHELPSLWSLFPAFSLGQEMFANNELVSVPSGAQGSSSGLSTGTPCPWPLSTGGLSWAAQNLLWQKQNQRDLGFFRSLDSWISFFFFICWLLHLPGSICGGQCSDFLHFSSLCPLCLLHGSSFSSHGAGAL